MVDEHLLVNSIFDTNVAQNEGCLNEEVACREKAEPHVAVSRHQSALFIIEESLVTRAGPEKAVERERGGHGTMEERVYLHAILVEIV